MTKIDFTNFYKYPSIDGLRAFSILIVIIAHINAHYGIPVLTYLFGAGIVGVYIFFVISGFLISSLLIKEKNKTGTVSLKNFYSRRTLRIFPLAYLYLSLVIALNLVFHLKIPGSDFCFTALFLANFAQFFNVHYLLHHFWSLAVEEQFYLFIAPLLKWPLTKVFGVLILLLPFTFLTRFLLQLYPDVFLTKMLFDLTRCMDGLIIGSCCAFIAVHERFPWYILKKHANWINLLCVLAIFVLKTDMSNPWLRLFFNHTTYSFFIGLLLLTNIQTNNSLLFKVLNFKPLAYIGLLSYSLYIWQQLFTDHSLMQFFPWNIIAIPIVAYFSYHYFELPFLRLKNKFQAI